MSTDLVAEMRAAAEDREKHCVLLEQGADEIARLRSQLTDFHNLDDVGEIRELKRELAEVRAELDALNPRKTPVDVGAPK